MFYEGKKNLEIAREKSQFMSWNGAGSRFFFEEEKEKTGSNFFKNVH
jgi:hypothetical protein